MIDFTITTHLDRSPIEVFTYVTDLTLLPTWQTNAVSSVTDDGGPVRLGSRLREVHRAPGGKLVHTLVEVCDYDPGRRFGLRVVEGTPVHLRIEFAEAGGGTTMRFNAYGSLRGSQRLLEPLVARLLRRQFGEHCSTLQRILG